MSTSFRLILPDEIRQAMERQAQAELPNECCGLLAGVQEEDQWLVRKHYPLRNSLESPTRFLGDAKDHFVAEKDMRKHEWDMLAVYHSHPTSEPIPSRTDLANNFWPGSLAVIISLVGGEPVVRAWRLFESEFQEVRWRSES